MTTLQPYRKTLVTKDTYDAMRRVEMAAKEYGNVQVEYDGVTADLASWEGVKHRFSGPLGLPAHLSMRPATTRCALEHRGASGVHALGSLPGAFGHEPCFSLSGAMEHGR